MKRNDIALIAVCVFISGIFSILATNMLFKGGKNNSTVEVVEKITTDFVLPDSRYFNEQSNNPTQQIQIGTGTNQVQFNQ